MGIYAADGSTNITFVSGTAVTGLYAADGGFNVVESAGTTPVGVYHPCGALNVTIAEIPGVWYGYYANDGSVNITRIDQDNGALKVTNTGGALYMLLNETQGFTIDATLPRSTVSIIDTTTPANNKSNVPINGFTFNDSTRAAITGSSLGMTVTTPRLVDWNSAPYIRSSPHNRELQSQTFDNAAWTKTRSSITQNSTTAPDGTSTADSWIEDGTAASSHQITSGVASVVGRMYNVSVYAKPLGVGATRYLQIAGGGIDAANEVANFDIVNGTVDVAATITCLKSATITSVGNGWYRCSIVAVPTTTGAFELDLVNAGTPNNVTAYNGDSTSGLYIWGMQSSQGAYLHPYRATVASAWYGIPIGYDRIGGRFGIHSEQGQTNFLLQSNHLGNTWTNIRSSETTEIATAPDGSPCADKIVEDNTVGDTHLIQQTSASLTSGTAYQFSVYLKAGERTWARLGAATTRFPDNVYCDFNLATGVKGTVGAGATNSGIQSIGDGWYRCWVGATCDSTGTNAFLIYIGEGDTDIIYNGDNASGIYAWGAQVEGINATSLAATTPPTSLIQTGTATATRPPDAFNCLTSTFPLSATEGTIIVWFRPYWVNCTANDRVFELHNGTANEDMYLARVTTQNPDDFSIEMVDGGVAQIALGASNAGAASLSGNKTAMFYKLNDTGLLVDGGSEVVDTACTIPTPTTLYIGSSLTSTRHLAAFIYKFTYIPRRLTTAELQAKTT